MENMRKPGSERAAQHPLQNSLPSKQSLKRKNSWDLDEMPVGALGPNRQSESFAAKCTQAVHSSHDEMVS